MIKKVLIPDIEEQIVELNERITKKLLENKKDLEGGVLQIRIDLLVDEIYSTICKHAKLIEKNIIKIVEVNYNQSIQNAIDKTGKKQYIDDGLVVQAPRGKGIHQVKLVLFKIETREQTSAGFISDDDLEKAYNIRGLKPADLFSICALNEKYPSFADEHSHGTHWKDSNGKWCFLGFGCFENECIVFARHNERGWNENWLFVGVLDE